MCVTISENLRDFYSNKFHLINMVPERVKLFPVRLSQTGPKSRFMNEFVSITMNEFVSTGWNGNSTIIVTDDYLCYKESKSPYNFFSNFNI